MRHARRFFLLNVRQWNSLREFEVRSRNSGGSIRRRRGVELSTRRRGFDGLRTCKQNLNGASGCAHIRQLWEANQRLVFKSGSRNSVAVRQERFFWILASFRLSYRPLRACSFAKASPKPKNPRSDRPHYFLKRSNSDFKKPAEINANSR